LILVASVLKHSVFVFSSNVKVHNVTIKTSLDAPLTDGIVPGMIFPPSRLNTLFMFYFHIA
jgi:hypothetical protein